MDKLDMMIKDKINCAAEGISPRSSITDRAEKRLTEKTPKRKGWRIAVSVCLAAVMCGTAVSAVKFGWIDEVFGAPTEYAEDYLSPINVSTENVSFEKYENAPSDLDFKLLEAVSDGEVLIINYELSGSLKADSVHEIAIYHPKKFDENIRSFSMSSWHTPLSDGSYGQIMCPDSGISSGDNVELRFIDDETSDIMGKASLTISEDVPKLVKKIDVGKTAKIRDRSKEYTLEKELVVENITISALTIKINYLTKDNSNNYAIGRDISIITDDGQTISLDRTFYSYDASTDLPRDENGYYKQYINVVTRDIIPHENIVSISIGDLIIPIQ